MVNKFYACVRRNDVYVTLFCLAQKPAGVLKRLEKRYWDYAKTAEKPYSLEEYVALHEFVQVELKDVTLDKMANNS